MTDTSSVPVSTRVSWEALREAKRSYRNWGQSTLGGYLRTILENSLLGENRIDGFFVKMRPELAFEVRFEAKNRGFKEVSDYVEFLVLSDLLRDDLRALGEADRTLRGPEAFTIAK